MDNIPAGTEVAKKAKLMIVCLLATNKVPRLPVDAFTRFIGDLGAHVAQPSLVTLPKPLVIRHLSFTILREAGDLYLGVEVKGEVTGQVFDKKPPILVVPIPDPYPSMPGEEEVRGKRWRYKIT
jgi:hypothetical protein